MGISDHLTCLLRNLYAGQEATVRTGHGTTDCSKLGKEYVKGVYCYLAYLTYMQSTSWEMPGWMTHKLESRLPGEISITSDTQMTSPLCRQWRRTKEHLDESERRKWKNWLKIQHWQNQILASSPITSWQIDWETMETKTDFIFLGSKITADGDCSHEIKRHLLLGRKARQLEPLLTKVCIVKAMVFPVVTHRCERWTIKKAERQRIDAFELWCWRRLLRVPWTARR